MLTREIRGAVRSDTRHPHAGAPLCVPCNYAGNTSQLAFPAPRGCPCTPALLCQADVHGDSLLTKGDWGSPRETLNYPGLRIET